MATATRSAARARPPARRLAELRAWVAVLRDELERRLRRGDPTLTPAERRALELLYRMERQSGAAGRHRLQTKTGAAWRGGAGDRPRRSTR